MLLIQKVLAGNIINSKWFIRFEAIIYSIDSVARQCKREQDLVNAIEEYMRTGSAAQGKVQRL